MILFNKTKNTDQTRNKLTEGIDIRQSGEIHLQTKNKYLVFIHVNMIIAQCPIFSFKIVRQNPFCKVSREII